MTISRAPQELQLVVADACLLCAERLVAADQRAEAASRYRRLPESPQPAMFSTPPLVDWQN